MNLFNDQQEISGYFADCLLETKYSPDSDEVNSPRNEAGYETTRQELIERINREITQIIFDNLNASQLEEIENLLDEQDAPRISAFLREAIPDLRRLILERLIELKNEIN